MPIVWVAVSVVGAAVLIFPLLRSWPKGSWGSIASRLKLLIVGSSLLLVAVPLIVVTSIYFIAVPWPVGVMIGVALLVFLEEWFRLVRLFSRKGVSTSPE